MVANVVSMAFVQRTEADIPWHKLGTSLAPGMSDAREIVAAAGMNHTVGLAKLFVHMKDGGSLEVPNARAIMRCDTKQVLGTATKSYAVVQNVEVVESVESWLKDGRMQFETAGILGSGRYWALARIGEDFKIAGKDRMIPYALIVWGHDGSSAIIVKLVVTRVVCQNTLGAALSEVGNQIHIRHTLSAKDRLSEADRKLGLVVKGMETLREKFEILAQTTIGQADVERIIDLVFPMPTNENTEEAEKARRAIQGERLALFNCYQNSPTVDRGTAWGLYNAVSEYTEHFQERRGQSPTSTNADWYERRAMYSLDGQGAAIRGQVLETLLTPA